MSNRNERRIDLRFILSIAACGIMSFSGVVVETAMNITFPALMSEFSVDTATVQWITTGYLLVLSIIMPVSALLKRRFRSQHLFIAAIALFMAGTLLCAGAPVFPLLVAGRIVQGVGTGIALPLMFNIVIEQSPIDKIGLMMGVATLITATAPAVGPSVGGLVVTMWGWRAIFLVLLPFLVISAVMGITCIRQVGETKPVKFHPLQFLALAGAFACLIFATSSASTAGWLSARVLVLIALFVVLIGLFAKLSVGSDAPLVRIEIFKTKPFTLSVLYMVLFQGIVLGLGYLIPYYAQEVGGYNEFTAGCLLLPGCIIGAILAPMGGRLLDVSGARKPITAGAILQFVALGCFTLFAVGGDPLLFALIYLIVPISQGFSMANSMTNGLSYLPQNLKTDGNATFNTLQQLGGALGTAVATSVMNMAQASVPGDLHAGTLLGAHTAFLVLLGASAVAMVLAISVFIVRGRDKKKAAASVQDAPARTGDEA